MKSHNKVPVSRKEKVATKGVAPKDWYEAAEVSYLTGVYCIPSTEDQKIKSQHLAVNRLIIKAESEPDNRKLKSQLHDAQIALLKLAKDQGNPQDYPTLPGYFIPAMLCRYNDMSNDPVIFTANIGKHFVSFLVTEAGCVVANTCPTEHYKNALQPHLKSLYEAVVIRNRFLELVNQGRAQPYTLKSLAAALKDEPDMLALLKAALGAPENGLYQFIDGTEPMEPAEILDARIKFLHALQNKRYAQSEWLSDSNSDYQQLQQDVLRAFSQQIKLDQHIVHYTTANQVDDHSCEPLTVDIAMQMRRLYHLLKGRDLAALAAALDHHLLTGGDAKKKPEKTIPSKFRGDLRIKHNKSFHEIQPPYAQNWNINARERHDYYAKTVRDYNNDLLPDPAPLASAMGAVSLGETDHSAPAEPSDIRQAMIFKPRSGAFPAAPAPAASKAPVLDYDDFVLIGGSPKASHAPTLFGGKKKGDSPRDSKKKREPKG